MPVFKNPIKKGVQPVSMVSSLDPGQQTMATQLQQMISGAPSPDEYMAGMTGFIGGGLPTPYGAGPLGGEI